MIDQKKLSLIANSVAVIQAYVPRIQQMVDRYNKMERMNWDTLSPDEKYKLYKESQSKRFKAEADVRRFINEKHNVKQTLKATRRRLQEAKK